MNKLNKRDIPKDYPLPAIWKAKCPSGVWVFGSPTMIAGICQGIRCFRFPLDVFTIDPKTLSQCTGRADKNGDLYFFGDIAIHPNGCKMLIKKLPNGSTYYDLTEYNTDWLSTNMHEAEIIGTIHD